MTINIPPRVSIGMPVYNGGTLLEQAIESILCQTFDDFELIISDNASTDNTRFISEKFADQDPRVRFVRQRRNIGAENNFYFVFNQAKGGFFQWAAHDDLWKIDWIEKAFNTLNDEIDIEFACPSLSIKDKHTGFMKEIDPNIFHFVERAKHRERLLFFLGTHFLSQKCSMVYSLFRKPFLASALKIQGIKDDGALCAILLAAGRGKIIYGSPFIKRWGFVRHTLRRFLPSSKRQLRLEANSLSASKRLLLELFPEEEPAITAIFRAQKPGYCPNDFLLTDISRYL